VKVRAGQIWKAPAPRVRGGFRYIRIEQVRGTEDTGRHALAREVDATGKRKGARTFFDWYKGERVESPPISITVRNDAPEGYEFVSAHDASASS